MRSVAAPLPSAGFLERLVLLLRQLWSVAVARWGRARVLALPSASLATGVVVTAPRPGVSPYRELPPAAPVDERPADGKTMSDELRGELENRYRIPSAKDGGTPTQMLQKLAHTVSSRFAHEAYRCEEGCFYCGIGASERADQMASDRTAIVTRLVEQTLPSRMAVGPVTPYELDELYETYDKLVEHLLKKSTLSVLLLKLQLQKEHVELCKQARADRAKARQR